MLPWGVPVSSCLGIDSVQPIHTWKVRLDKKRGDEFEHSAIYA